MEAALIFGALSPVGFPLSEGLLDAGICVYALSSAITEEEEKQEAANEFFLGRHALFCPQRKISEQKTGALIFADTFRVTRTCSDTLKEKMRAVLAKSQSFRPIIFFSAYCPRTADAVGGGRKMAAETERFFIETLRQRHRKKAVIARADPKLLIDRDNAAKIVRLVIDLADQNDDGMTIVDCQRRMHDPVD